MCSLRRLSARLQEAQAGVANGDASPVLTFDKDDDDTLDFVAASANLRSLIFGIETKSKFDIKRKFSLEMIRVWQSYLPASLQKWLVISFLQLLQQMPWLRVFVFCRHSKSCGMTTLLHEW